MDATVHFFHNALLLRRRAPASSPSEPSIRAPPLFSPRVTHSPVRILSRANLFTGACPLTRPGAYPGLVGSHDAQWPRGIAPLRCVTVVDGACPASAPVAPLPRDIRINVLSPGAVDTESLRSTLAMVRDPDAVAVAVRKVGEGNPTGRIAEPRGMGTAAVFLSSDATSVVTGIELFADGAWPIFDRYREPHHVPSARPRASARAARPRPAPRRRRDGHPRTPAGRPAAGRAASTGRPRPRP